MHSSVHLTSVFHSPFPLCNHLSFALERLLFDLPHEYSLRMVHCIYIASNIVIFSPQIAY